MDEERKEDAQMDREGGQNDDEELYHSTHFLQDVQKVEDGDEQPKQIKANEQQEQQLEENQQREPEEPQDKQDLQRQQPQNLAAQLADVMQHHPLSHSQISASAPLQFHEHRKSSNFNLRDQLLETRKKYIQLLNADDVEPADKKMLTTMLQNIDMQLKDLDGQNIKDIENTRVDQPTKSYSITQSLRVIFDHYCKQSYATGKNATFDRIKHESNIMTMNKFMMMSRDFELIGTDAMKMQDMVEVFKKHAENYKEMDFDGFCKALGKVAEMMFQGNSDKLYEHMEINTEGKFREKAKKLGVVVKEPIKVGYKIHVPKRVPTVGREIQRKLASANNSLKELPEVRHKKPPLPRPPLLSHKAEQMHIPLPATRLSNKAIRPVQPSFQHNLSSNRLSTASGQQTGYSQIHGSKKRGLTLASTPQDKKQYRLNNIVAEAKEIVEKADRRPYMAPEDNRASLAGILDDTEDEFLKKHWEMQEGKHTRVGSQSLHNPSYF